MVRHTVRQGECLVSLAAKHGVPVDRIKNHPDNAALMREREHEESTLKAGDALTIPPLERRTEDGATEEKHVFRYHRPWAVLRVRLFEFDEPRAEEEYVVYADGKPLEEFEDGPKQTDSEGLVECRIPPETRVCRIVIGECEDEYDVAMGEIDPIGTDSGVHTRLQNLGLYDGSVDAESNSETASGLGALRKQVSPDESTAENTGDGAEKLKEFYGI